MKRLSPMTWRNFLEFLSSRKVFCFGAGIQGERMGEFLIDAGLGTHLLGYIDNHKAGTGNCVAVDDCQYPILSLDEVLQQLGEDTFILITAYHFEEIYAQLAAADPENRIAVTSYAEISEQVFRQSDYPAVCRDYDTPVIPKVIHYVWVGGEKPLAVRENIAAWHRLCPDYEIVEWNEHNYDMGKCAYLKEAYESGLYGYVPDYLRLDVVYEQGGIYLDTDIELLRNLDDLLYQDAFGCVDGTLTWNAGSGFGARPGMEILRVCRDYYQDRHFRNEDGTMDRRSCTSHQYKTIRKMGGYSVHEGLHTIAGMYIYPMIFQGRNFCVNVNRVTDKTYWIHHGTMSWFHR